MVLGHGNWHYFVMFRFILPLAAAGTGSYGYVLAGSCLLEAAS
jgi:hypothetical protein